MKLGIVRGAKCGKRDCLVAVRAFARESKFTCKSPEKKKNAEFVAGGRRGVVQWFRIFQEFFNARRLFRPDDIATVLGSADKPLITTDLSFTPPFFSASPGFAEKYDERTTSKEK